MRTSTPEPGPRNDQPGVRLRKPAASDGTAVSELVAACPPLDRNSLYCNLLQCTHFAETSVLAERRGRALGWISGYRLPRQPSTLFVWQVAVHADARGLGLAKKMLAALLERHDDVMNLQTTVTPDNDASRALFRSLARQAGAELRETAGFDEEEHVGGSHASERLITIGPMRPDATVPGQQGRDSRSAA